MSYYTREAFIKKYYPFVRNATRGTGLFPEILIAQAIIESQGSINGKYYVGASKLASTYNNFFGIKAAGGWKGPKVNLKTGEVINDRYVTITDAFRVYNTPEESIADYIKFLKENPRYTKAGVFEADDYRQQALRIHAAGYATGKDYGDLVTQIASKVKELIMNLPGADDGLNFGKDNILTFTGFLLFFFLINKSRQ
jgi:mannosyl-glycoprotein endo-beta-N-acetylglucosaminidase/stage II sporulation protein P